MPKAETPGTELTTKLQIPSVRGLAIVNCRCPVAMIATA